MATNSAAAADEAVYALLDQGEQDARAETKDDSGGRQNGGRSGNSPSLTSQVNRSHTSNHHRRGSRGSTHSPQRSSAHPADRTGNGRSRGHNARNRYSEEREENDERRSRRSKDLAEDDAIRHSSDQDSANESNRSRNFKKRSPGYRGRRAPSRDRDHQRSRVDSYVPRRRSANGNGRRSERRDENYPDRRDRERDRERSRSPRRDGRRGEPEPRPARARSPAPPAPSSDERDRLTLFVSQLANRTRSKELKAFFNDAGCSVVEAQIVKDRVSGRSKGLGYVEFKDEASVSKAMDMTGRKLNDVPIIVQPTEAEKNRQKRKTEGTASSGAHPPRLYVGNIHFSVTEQDLQEVFEPYGHLDFVKLARDEADGRSRGYGFVQFTDANSARQALESMNGFDLGGRPLRVGLGSDRMPMDTTTPQQEPAAPSFSGVGGRGSHAGGSTNFDRNNVRNANGGGNASALDDSDVGGIALGNPGRSELMRKLLRQEDGVEPGASNTTSMDPRVPDKFDPVVAPSRCIKIRNMFDVAEEEEKGPGWQPELKDEVREECEESYGVVKHIGLKLDDEDGPFVYVKFDRVEGGKNACRGLNGRFFSGRTIYAEYTIEAMYNTLFPEATDL